MVLLLYPYIRFILLLPLKYRGNQKGGRRTTKTKRKYFYLNDFEHRLLVGCLLTARNEYLHDGKPMEDVDDLVLKIIDAPSKKVRVIRTQEV